MSSDLRATVTVKEIGQIWAGRPGPEDPAGHTPKLTVRMVARIQGFPDAWEFAGNKTARYRQIGNAFPAPVAAAVGESVCIALAAGHRPAQQGTRRGVWTEGTAAASVQERLFLSTVTALRGFSSAAAAGSS